LAAPGTLIEVDNGIVIGFFAASRLLNEAAVAAMSALILSSHRLTTRFYRFNKRVATFMSHKKTGALRRDATHYYLAAETL
jgi:hypothetical protein